MRNPVAGILLFIAALVLIASVFYMSRPPRRRDKYQEVTPDANTDASN